MKKKVVGSMSEWSGVLKDLFRQIADRSINLKQMQAFLEHRNPFDTEGYSALIYDWQNFYHDLFEIDTDFSDLRIPEKQEGFDRLIIVAEGMTPQKLYDKCKELFPCWKYTDEDLDKIVHSDRTAKDVTYAIWIRNQVEADEELKNLSADDLKKRNIPGITLEERLIYELKYFKETNKHLDIDNITLCTGSRYSDGGVPSVSWFIDWLEVLWYGADFRYGGLRSRRAVS